MQAHATIGGTSGTLQRSTQAKPFNNSEFLNIGLTFYYFELLR
jgi:hypothetical protein